MLRFGFAGVSTSSWEAFKDDFVRRIKSSLKSSGVEYDQALTAGGDFSSAIQILSAREGKPVVILIDEYDAPMGHSLHDLKLANAIREEMSNFFIQIKDHEPCVRVLMMTGVSQFATASVFSALNNVSDLSLEPSAAALLGYTEEELLGAFEEHLHAHAKVMGGAV